MQRPEHAAGVRGGRAGEVQGAHARQHHGVAVQVHQAGDAVRAARHPGPAGRGRRALLPVRRGLAARLPRPSGRGAAPQARVTFQSISFYVHIYFLILCNIIVDIDPCKLM